MSTSKNRRKASILFADIVGYTAMMQANETEALASLQNFETSLKAVIPIHAGQIIQFYGDGCLCTFNNSIEAVRAAQQLQADFQTASIPVRIGLHVGNVIFKDSNVYGDAVNIASRIESLGIAGSILLSQEIQEEISHLPSVQTTSLGQYELKNSKGIMSVYAVSNEGLIVPTLDQIQGKGKRIATRSSLQKQLRAGLIGFFAMSIGALIFSQYSANSKSNTINADIKEQRIAILPFKNNTNDPNLDMLGDMAADWINQGLMTIEEAEVVSPYTVRSHKAAIGITANDALGRPSFAELTGARNVITGNYYQDKEYLIFKLEILDALDGNLRYGFDPIKGAASDKEALITKMRAIITGYWVARDLVDSDIIKAPNLEAYTLFTKALQNQDITNEKILEILALDSTFYLPRIHFLNSNRFNLADRTHFDFLDRHKKKLNIYERGWYDFLVNYYQANKKEAYLSLNNLRKKYPNDFVLNQEAASVAMELLYNPALAIDIFNELDITKITPESAGVYYNWRIQNYATSLHLLNKQEELEQFCKETTPNQAAWLVPYYNAMLFPAVNKQDLAALKIITSDYKSNPGFNPFYYWLRVFGFARNPDNTSEVQAFWETELGWLYSILDPSMPFAQLILTELELLEGKPLSYQVKNQIPTSSKLDFTNDCYLPALKAIEGKDLSKAETLINQFLAYLVKDTSPISSSYKYGFIYYDIGILFTRMGNTAQALLYLQKAIDAGMTLNGTEFLRDGRLRSLYDLPAFQDMIQPIQANKY